jgi:putative molybdopterin biosynthesis protein
MDKIETLHAFEQLKILSDARRLDILRRLMAEPATLTQLGQTLNESPAWVRHHIKILENAGLVEMAGVRVVGRATEKYYRARASALLLRELILPKSKKPFIIFSGSHDSAIEHIARNLAPNITLLTLPVGSLDGLINLRQGLCHVSGTHLLDASGEYNTPYIRHLFPDQQVSLVTLAHRTQGLIVAPGNPKGIKEIMDLSRDDVTFINRNPGSGTRIWFDRELNRLGLPVNSIRGYENYVSTHSAAAKAVQTNVADAALGIQAAAHEAQVNFVPLFEERYDLVIPAEHAQLVKPMLDYLQTASFRNELNSLTGYNPEHSGEQVPL